MTPPVSDQIEIRDKLLAYLDHAKQKPALTEDEAAATAVALIASFLLPLEGQE